MDSNYGGLSSNERQRQTAAEIARKKVLAAYSSTVEDIKNLPPNSKDILLKHQSRNLQPDSQSSYSATSSTSANSSTDFNPKSYNIPSRQPEYISTYSTGQQFNSFQTQPDYHESYSQQSYSSYDSASYTSQPPSENQPSQYNQSQTYSNYNPTANPKTSETLKDAPINQANINAEWQKYHSAWQDYYKNYYSNYYAQAAQTYIAKEKIKDERIATGKTTRIRNLRRLAPVGALVLVVLIGLFLQYNRLIFAPIMAYVSPGNSSVATSIEAVDPTINQTVPPEPRLIIPKLNIDVPVAFGINTSEIDSAMNQGVAQFSIPGANALPGQVGNLVLSGHSAGDIYSNNQYQFIFSGLERLENNDLIYINYNSIRYTYQMTKREVVEPTNVGALIYETNKPMLTLITCTPLGTSRYRLLITAEQISPSYDDNNIAIPEVPDIDNSQDNTEMPANEPSFFENIWNGIFGH